MLSAQKEQIQLPVDTTRDDLPVGSFGKVVNSIQGLQERLESFSADDINDAHDKAQTLLSRLSDIQQKLATFIEIKASLGIVRDAIEQASRDSADIDTLDAPETHALIQRLIQANKLIQFPRLNKSAKISPTQLANHDSTETHSQLQGNDPLPPIAADEKEELDTAQPLAIDPALLTSEPATQSDITTATSMLQDNEPSNQLAPDLVDLSSATAPDTLPASEPEILQPYEFQIDTCPPTVSGSSDPSPSVQESPLLISPADETTENTLTTPPTPDFDQRLLEDLIKNYGEFVASRSSSPTIEPPDTPAVNTTETPTPPSATRSSEIELQRKTLPSTKRDGDLDRELKKLIKDYGEYDLYSRQSPINLKTGVIAAFLLLALIFSGFYYFAPKTSTSQDSAASQNRFSTSAGSSDQDSLADRPRSSTPETKALHATENNSRSKIDHKERVK